MCVVPQGQCWESISNTFHLACGGKILKLNQELTDVTSLFFFKKKIFLNEKFQNFLSVVLLTQFPGQRTCCDEKREETKLQQMKVLRIAHPLDTASH